MKFKKSNLSIFSYLLLGLMMSTLVIACSDESSSNNDSDSNDGTTLTTDEDGNVDQVNCGPGDQIFIDGVDVCAE